MARFNINTFNPIYPESNDKKGEIQLRVIEEKREVGENWTEEMRLDLLPCFTQSSNAAFNSLPAGRQTMFRTVFTDENDIYWAFGGNNSFLNPDGVTTTNNINFLDFVKGQVQEYQRYLNAILYDQGFETTEILITKIHVIGSNIQFIQHTGNTAIFLHTYDVIFYGQQTPNPYEQPEPAPACEILTDYSLSVQYQFPATKAIGYVNPGDTKIGVIELKAKGGGAGTQACVGQFRVNTPIPPYFVNGYQYCIRVDYTPILNASIDFVLEVQGINVGTYTLDNTGNSFYIPCTYNNANFTIRWQFAQQSPTTPENNPIINFSLYTNTCILT